MDDEVQIAVLSSQILMPEDSGTLQVQTRISYESTPPPPPTFLLVDENI
jgi:hypothetical protein